MLTGRGVKPDKAQDAVLDLHVRAQLVTGEEVQLFVKCNNFKPATDALLVTNGRVLGIHGGKKAVSFAVCHNDITDVECAEGRGTGTVTVKTTDGREMTFKGVASDDLAAVAEHVEQGRAHPDASVIAAVGAHNHEAAVAERDREARKNRGKTERRDARLARDAEETRREAGEHRAYGNKVADEQFGGRRVRIYGRGYVRVSRALFGSGAQFERLRSIEASSDVSKKTALGRGVAAVGTGGLNLMGSNKRGDVYLTIQTDSDTYVLHADPPTAMNLKAVKKLEAAGLAAIHVSADRTDEHSEHPKTVPLERDRPTVQTPPQSQTVPTSTDAPAAAHGEGEPGEGRSGRSASNETASAGSADSETASPAARLRQLHELRTSGLVSEQEYEALRAKILNSL